MLVSGRAHVDGGGELDPLYQFVETGPFVHSDPDGAYCLDFQTSSLTILDSHCFDLDFTNHEINKDLETDGFAFILPFPDGTERLALRHGTEVLDHRAKSQHPPELSLNQVQMNTTDDGSIPISWTGFDQDNDELQYAVLYSQDDGGSWSPLTVGFKETFVEFDTNLWAGSETTRLRISASDGFNTSSVDTDPFQVAPKPPSVWIYQPQSETALNPYETVFLNGHAEDLEDGLLQGSNLVWTSNIDGFLGTGEQLILPGLWLTPGDHTITLTAVDGDGQLGTTSVEVFIGQKMYLPVMSKTD